VCEDVKTWVRGPPIFTRRDSHVESPLTGERMIKGTFVEVIPYNRLVIEMHVVDWEGKPLFKARTEVTFADDVIGARMDLVQTYAVVDQAKAAPMLWGASEGWRTTLDKLQKEVTRMRDGGEAAQSG
jgi:uncharacterized protein YndB with AHSA1/START domain